MRARKTKIQARELVSAGWVLLVTFLIGLPIVFVEYGEHDYLKEIFLLLYLFLEFLPMVLYALAILLPTLSPHLLLPWVIINVILLLISTILALSLSIAEPTLPMVLMALGFSILLIFPILLVSILSLPLIVYVKKFLPNYKQKIRKSELYHKVTGTKTCDEIEREIVWRRKEQVRNVVITERDFEQFIFVNKAAQKWKTKLKKNKEPKEELKDILDEGNITVNQPTEETIEESKNGEILHIVTDTEPLIPATTVYDNGKFVTDV
jgi:hypothetical protein